MILYKYIDKTSLERFFKDGYISIKFTPYSEFNDPFESYGYELSLDGESLEPLAMRGRSIKMLPAYAFLKILSVY